VFFLVPILFNIILTWFLIDYQLKHSRDTRRWWCRHPGTALGFAILSSVDLEALNVVSSRCAGYNEFNARFTEGGRKRILISIGFIACVEDVPQLIIYALYQRYIVITEIIPILVLSSSCIVLLFKLVSFSYLMLIYKPDRALTSTMEKIDDINSDTSSLGDTITFETTTGRQNEVTELGDIDRSSEIYVDSDNNDNGIEVIKVRLTKGGLLVDISGDESQINERTSEEQIVKETIKTRNF
jgi:hypothetical protein